jgi:hypothetical protein
VILKLDFDARYGRRLALAEMVRRAERANLTIAQLWRRRSPSGKGWHYLVTVEPAPITATAVVALQLLFGSDPLREAYLYNRARVVDGGSSGVAAYWRELHAWNVLYRRTRAMVWQKVEAKLLAAHRERTGRRARQPRAN